MKTRRVVGVVAAGAMLAALGAGVAVAAASDPTPSPGSRANNECPYADSAQRGDGQQMRAGMGPGRNDGAGQGQRGQGFARGGGPGGAGMRGAGPSATAEAAGELTAEQESTLAAMAEEEKLAHDLYTAFAANYDDQRFDRVAASEKRHLEAVRSMLERYDIKDPTLGLDEGKFASAEVQSLYDKWLAQGNKSLEEALAVGAELERADIADLKAAAKGLDAPDVARLYEHLLRASEQHLAAFTR